MGLGVPSRGTSLRGPWARGLDMSLTHAWDSLILSLAGCSDQGPAAMGFTRVTSLVVKFDIISNDLFIAAGPVNSVADFIFASGLVN